MRSNIKDQINILRGFAIVAVVIIHITSYFSQIGTFSALPVTIASIDIFSQFAVPMFILISGIVLSLRYDGEYSIKTFYKKRINRILVPYIIWSLIYIAIAFIGNSDILATEIIFKLFTGTAFYHLWFFFLIFQLYLFFPFYRKFIKGKSFFVIVFILILQIAFNHYKIGLIENEQLSIVFKRLFLSHIFYFSLGIWIADNIKKVEKLLSKLNYLSNSFLLLVIVWGSYIFSYNWLAINNHFFEQLPMLMIIEKITLPLLYVLIFIALYYFATKISSLKIRNSMEIISRYSFGIYLSHALILFALIRALKKVSILPDNVLFYVLTFIGTIVFSWLFCFITEKTKLSKYLLSINQKKKVENIHL
ncbi:MAG: acyltransferase family protein [Candidatus Delongbacteria bacterium]|nr:acyltransferase family protein [Candidatus Delongbacteria bacterium]